MGSELNFVFCFDDNYLIQSETSIISLLDCVSEPVNIYILKKSSNKKLEMTEKVLKHKNLNYLEINNLNLTEYEFPNLTNVHVSEATYFRIFISEYIPNEIKFLTYLDADTVCLNDPIWDIRNTFSKLENSNYSIAARTEIENSHKDNEVFKRLKIHGPYFNAGVLFINLEYWRINNFQEKLIDVMNEIRNEIVHWDQDVLNKFFNGSYLKISSNMNFNSNKIDTNTDLSSIFFAHYIGSKKPWTILSKIDKSYEIYQNNFRKISNQNMYHITHTWKKKSLLLFIKLILNLNIFKLEYPIEFIKSFIKSLKR